MVRTGQRRNRMSSSSRVGNSRPQRHPRLTLFLRVTHYGYAIGRRVDDPATRPRPAEDSAWPACNGVYWRMYEWRICVRRYRNEVLSESQQPVSYTHLTLPTIY